ncbi:MAG: sulfite exporter TauE/SafE family protein [Acidobacteria bacterium]|nr:sulfite exporter TauE/SafE family protein [Acidobacteriota bacterium]
MLNLPTALLLLLAAVLGGALNAVAGGGSFITFPTLLFSGVSPVPANATNTVALWTGLAVSGGTFRHHLNAGRQILYSLVAASVLGGSLGAILLLRTPAHTFMRILPWLMLSATLLFVLGRRSAGSNSASLVERTSPRAILLASSFQLLVGIYGGYFGGGMGIVILAMLAALGMGDIHEMNALKTILSSAINGMAVIVFVASRAVYWRQALVMIVGAALGGYFGAHFSLRLAQSWIRGFVIVVGSTMTAYFFFRSY